MKRTRKGKRRENVNETKKQVKTKTQTKTNAKAKAKAKKKTGGSQSDTLSASGTYMSNFTMIDPGDNDVPVDSNDIKDFQTFLRSLVFLDNYNIDAIPHTLNSRDAPTTRGKMRDMISVIQWRKNNLDTFIINLIRTDTDDDTESLTSNISR
jgi:hypothetical protein